jgi:hypothetical protein
MAGDQVFDSIGAVGLHVCNCIPPGSQIHKENIKNYKETVKASRPSAFRSVFGFLNTKTLFGLTGWAHPNILLAVDLLQGIELPMKLQSHSSPVACLPPLTQRKTRDRAGIKRFPLRQLGAWL